MKNILITVIAFGFVTGCSVFGSIGGSAGSSVGSSGGSSGGFFGKRRPKETVLEQRIEEPDIRVLIPVVNEVKVDKYRGGALIRARGTVDRQGYSEINLVAVNDGLPDENGVVTYEFKGEKPLITVAGPTARSKEVYAGASITARRLPSVKRIRVIASQNQIVVSK
jgi:hypothetical protein